MKIKQCIKKVSYFIAIIFFITGFIGLFFSNNISELNQPSGIVVDKEGKIFCGLMNDSKINIYDKNGLFIKSININADGGVFRIKIENSELKVATTRNDMLYTYDINGKLLQKEENKLSYDNFGHENEKKFVDSGNNTYIIKSFVYIYPYIQKIDHNGKKIKLISVPFNKWIFMKPIPAWVFMFIGIILLSPDLNKMRKKYKE